MSIHERQAEFTQLINTAIKNLEEARKVASGIPYQSYDLASDELWEIIRQLDLLA